MPSKVSSLTTISRAEFILPNLGSLIMGLAWGVHSPVGINELVILILVSFTVINLSSAIGAQVNTLSDQELDSRDERKRSLVSALNAFVLAIPAAVVYVLRNFKQLHTLSHEYETSNNKGTTAQKLVSFSTNNSQ